MARAKVAVGILLASTLLAVGLVLYFGQGDEVDRLLRHYGGHSGFEVPQKALDVHWTSVVVTARQLDEIERSLIRMGWRRTGDIEMTPPDGSDRYILSLVMPIDGRPSVSYHRRATKFEALLGRLGAP